jgi:hypothetical protein
MYIIEEYASAYDVPALALLDGTANNDRLYNLCGRPYIIYIMVNDVVCPSLEVPRSSNVRNRCHPYP